MLKVTFKIAKIFGIVLLVLLLLIVLLVVRIATTPAVPNRYTKTVETGGELEAAYLATGPYKTAYLEATAGEPLKKYEAYYPQELEEGPYPAVVFVYGTGVYGSKYKALFRHLASWGFIVLGNEDPGTWSGISADQTLDWLLKENQREGSVFFGRVDLENIGISGHSQGGVGVFNAVTENAHSGLYKTAVALSPTNEEGAAALGIPYDLTKVEIPVLMLAGTQGEFEMEMVIPFQAMTAMYDRLSVPKAMARRTDSDHGGMLYKADGYVTAWFLWQLQGNEEAGRAFTGEDPELARNGFYQDARVNLGF